MRLITILWQCILCAQLMARCYISSPAAAEGFTTNAALYKKRRMNVYYMSVLFFSFPSSFLNFIFYVMAWQRYLSVYCFVAAECMLWSSRLFYARILVAHLAAILAILSLSLLSTLLSSLAARLSFSSGKRTTAIVHDDQCRHCPLQFCCCHARRLYCFQLMWDLLPAYESKQACLHLLLLS